MRFLMAFLLVVVASPVMATESTQSSSLATAEPSGLGWNGWGVRAGVTDDSEQVVGGVHFNLGEVSRDLRFQPDLQVGSGDDHTTVYGTVPLYYRFRRMSRVVPYAGGGLALGYVDVDLPDNSQGDDSEFETGAKATGGLEWPRVNTRQSFFVELSLGFGDVHDVSLLAAWSF
jgi:opacity protein-like surface antigen